MPRMRWRHHDLIKPIELNFERKITKARISTNIFPSQFLAQQHAKKYNEKATSTTHGRLGHVLPVRGAMSI